jgi:hypothetical protein
LPLPPVYTNRVGSGLIFNADQNFPFKWSGGANSILRFSKKDVDAINNDDAWLWVYGVIRYEDFLNDEYDFGFVAHWEALPGVTVGATGIKVARGFVVEGPPPYNYRRKCDKQI